MSSSKRIVGLSEKIFWRCISGKEEVCGKLSVLCSPEPLPQVIGLKVITPLWSAKTPVGFSRLKQETYHFLLAPGVFRIDHDERFNQTTHFQYQPWKKGPWVAFNWRYDHGLVAGAVPCRAQTATCAFSTSPADGGGGVTPGTTTLLPEGQIALVNNLTGLPLTADQEFQAGLTCDGKPAAPSRTGPALFSTFSGTHYVTPRTETVELAFHF